MYFGKSRGRIEALPTKMLWLTYQKLKSYDVIIENHCN